MVNINDRIDELELALQDAPPVDCPVTHSFTPGFYVRQIFMPTGTMITSQIHNARHSYQITKGIACVKVNDDEWEILEAPFVGITEPGTRRVLYIQEDTIWTTFHPILESEQPAFNLEEEITEAVEKIGKRIIEPHVNELLGGIIKNNIITNKTESVCHG